MWNILIGIAFVVGALSGKMVLRGTESNGALAVVGGLLIVWGIFQIAQKSKGK